jgi:hypothetical protein
MNLQKIWYIITFLGIIVFVFYLGFLYGNREKYNNEEDEILVIGPNYSIQNSLTLMEIRPILGSNDSQNIQAFGNLYFKLNKDQIEILIQINNVPNQVTQQNGKVRKDIPNELKISTAKRSLDGQNYDYEEIGKLVFDQPQNNLRSGKFSTIIKTPITSIERIVFQPVLDNDTNIFVDDNPDLPSAVRSSPAPYFWVEI